jgi:hypothetical protein
MKYLLNVTSDIKVQIGEDNYRGEPRWERHVLDAFIRSGLDIHTTRDIWQPLDIPNNLHSG